MIRTDHPLSTGDPLVAAGHLLGSRLRAGDGEFRIVEVEAYGGPPGSPFPDPASHGFGGPTPRNRVMFGRAGHLYVYRSYGIHLCANVTYGPVGQCGGVLLRAAEVTAGHDEVADRRPGVPGARRARGPGNLGAAVGVTLADNGTDLLDRNAHLRLDLTGSDEAVAEGPRVGVSRASRRPWRLWLPSSPAVSAYKRSPRAVDEGDEDW
ncbi:DNA-3-methyladenine glycosylase [Williamsia sterculiae]|uniref:Putative 3-methyladenine DNA glycosylase n=1 Tax=Williamsia sterculiae TaxID=1344003 RepID=A0A1N7HG98_9NOCA|nr:DNA-3-methyladenine glycosylase [Williamsia sterculiae]SIS23916.1 DNA-3-methyladenine glycosylase [Williamsia sterculiae]